MLSIPPRRRSAGTELADAFRRIQRSEGLGMRIERREQGEATVLFFRGNVTPQLEADIGRVRQVLGIQSSLEFDPVYGSVPRHDAEIAILTRSMLEILIDFAQCIDVPPEHVASGRTNAGYPVGRSTGLRRLGTIHSASMAPAHAYAAVRYRDTWYWVDNHDLDSKRAFAFMMMFFSLAESGPTAPAPMLTMERAEASRPGSPWHNRAGLR